jgi:hypothetical protein
LRFKEELASIKEAGFVNVKNLFFNELKLFLLEYEPIKEVNNPI